MSFGISELSGLNIWFILYIDNIKIVGIISIEIICYSDFKFKLVRDGTSAVYISTPFTCSK